MREASDMSFLMWMPAQPPGASWLFSPSILPRNRIDYDETIRLGDDAGYIRFEQAPEGGWFARIHRAGGATLTPVATGFADTAGDALDVAFEALAAVQPPPLVAEWMESANDRIRELKAKVRALELSKVAAIVQERSDRAQQDDTP